MKPILFNTEIIKAILDGRKSQFREVIDFCKVDDIYINENGKNVISINDKILNTITEEYIQSFINKNSKYKVDDILYVKETFCLDRDGFPVFKAGFIFSPYFNGIPPRWKPSTHLKKEEARIFLKVTNVRVERLQDISNIDIKNEGLPLEYKGVGNCFKKGGSKWWINLWNSTAKDGYKWEDNPYVFVYEFERANKES